MAGHGGEGVRSPTTGCPAIAGPHPRRPAPHRKQKHRGSLVPLVEVDEAEVAEKPRNPGGARYAERDPRPSFTSSQRAARQPDVDRSRCDERAAERDTIVHHEVDDAAPVKGAEL